MISLSLISRGYLPGITFHLLKSISSLFTFLPLYWLVIIISIITIIVIIIQGDSGGPIQIPIVGLMDNCMWLQVGVTSRGPLECGFQLPAIYSKVSTYLPWIQKIVWP